MSSFYVILPSNTTGEANTTNSFTVRLPRKLQFSSDWAVGLAVAVYPHTWPSLGTLAPQSIEIEWQNGARSRFPMPCARFDTPRQLEQCLNGALAKRKITRPLINEYRMRQLGPALKQQHEEDAARASVSSTAVAADTSTTDNAGAHVQIAETSAQTIRSTPPLLSPAPSGLFVPPPSTPPSRGTRNASQSVVAKKVGLTRADAGTAASPPQQTPPAPDDYALWIEAVRRAEESLNFIYSQEERKFRVQLAQRFIRAVRMTPQLDYLLGFPDTHKEPLTASALAHYSPDLNGGIAALYIYAPGLIEPVIVGDTSAPVLRIVNVRGANDELVEDSYTNVQYHRLRVKEIAEIRIDIRSTTGELIPFEFGTCTLTLHFKKIPYF